MQQNTDMVRNPTFLLNLYIIRWFYRKGPEEILCDSPGAWSICRVGIKDELIMMVTLLCVRRRILGHV
jgi:hypothetical protein